MSSVFRMSGIFSSKLARRWVKLESMYRYLLSFQMRIVVHAASRINTRKRVRQSILEAF